LAFAIAIIQIYLLPSTSYFVISPIILIAIAGTYTILQTSFVFGRLQKGISAFSILGVDIIVCCFLLLSSGALYSPFLLYTLVPVVTSALLLDSRVTFSIAGLSGTYVIISHLFNPFASLVITQSELSYFLVYMVAVSLAAVLPYLINANLRKRLEINDMMRERKRLSREIHDGVAQTVFTLRWQVQLVDRRLAKMGIHLAEVKELVKLSAEAHQDTRECLELLRNYSGDGNFVHHLEAYLKRLNQGNNLEVSLDADAEKIHLQVWAELELMRICQEALTNIRKHARAHHVQINVKSLHGCLKMGIADDGCGFDAAAYHLKGINAETHGLAVMQERAELIGGKLKVISIPEQGTNIQVEVPSNPTRKGRLWEN
jgi:signal transduction histidine kinase